ncbi:MAG: hypothetical protein ABJ382_21220 [Ilumatobacter sp.]
MFEPGVLIPFVLSVAALVGFFVWYRRTMKDMTVDSESRPIPGARLTAARLRGLASPPWRVVYEIGPKQFGAVDHVVIGPNGVLAIEPVTTDRPTEPSSLPAARLVADAAIARGAVADVASRVGSDCRTLVRVHWGVPQPELPAGIDVAPGLVAVEGQRLVEWLVALPPGPLGAAQVDQVWHAVTTGIGRPDPLG